MGRGRVNKGLFYLGSEVHMVNATCVTDTAFIYSWLHEQLVCQVYHI